MKLTSRLRNLEIQKPGEEVTKHDAIITLMADLQQEQDKESEILMALLPDKVRCYKKHNTFKDNQQKYIIKSIILNTGRSFRLSEFFVETIIILLY